MTAAKANSPQSITFSFSFELQINLLARPSTNLLMDLHQLAESYGYTENFAKHETIALLNVLEIIFITVVYALGIYSHTLECCHSFAFGDFGHRVPKTVKQSSTLYYSALGRFNTQK